MVNKRQTPLVFNFKLLVLSVLFTLVSVILTAAPHAVKGVLDLRDYSYDEILYLQGEWKFRALDNSGNPLSNEYHYLTAPGDWNSVTGETYSTGEYLLKILLPENTPPTMGLYVPELSQSIEIWVNGKLLRTTGNIKTGKCDYSLSISPFSVNGDVEIRIIIRNSIFRKGGLIYIPRIGLNKKIHSLKVRKVWIEAFCIGSLLLVALYHLLLFHHNIKNSSDLYLGLSALLMMFRGLLTGENTIQIIFPNFPWVLNYHLEYIFAYLNGGMFLLFAYKCFPFHSKIIDKATIILPILSVGFAAVSIFLPLKILSQSVYVLQLFLFFCGGFGLIIFIHAFIEKKQASLLFSLGGIIFFIFLFVDIFYYNGAIKGFLNLALIGMVIFFIFQTATISKLHSGAFYRIKNLTIELEQEVSRQTADLKSTNDMLLREIEQRKKAESRLEMLSTTDSLTGAANRLKITPYLQQAHHIFNRYGKSFGIIMLDIDNFKKINDQYGHGVGDEVLKEIVLVSEKQIRECDILARWGGEEFMILMPEMGKEGAIAAAERLRREIEKFNFSVTGNVTASFGVAVPSEKEVILKDLLKRVDDNLYQAKAEGKNRVVG